MFDILTLLHGPTLKSNQINIGITNSHKHLHPKARRLDLGEAAHTVYNSQKKEIIIIDYGCVKKLLRFPTCLRQNLQLRFHISDEDIECQA